MERGEVRVRCGGATAALRSCYAAAGDGEALAVAGSNGLLELAINGGAFAREQGAVRGASVGATW